MKKLFVILLMTWAVATVAAEPNAEVPEGLERFALEMQGLDTQIRDAFARQDYVSCAELNYRALSLLENNRNLLLTLMSEKQIATMKSMYYYDLACAYGRREFKEGSLYHLQQAASHGYSDWKHIGEDHDLDVLRGDERFDTLVAQVRERSDFLLMLKHAAPYTRSERYDTLPEFTYERPDSPSLQRVRAYFNLDSVAAGGDEVSKIKRILTYVHNLIEHDGHVDNPVPRNAIGLAEACHGGKHALNCRGMAIVLSECYLAMGIPTRVVTCMPREYAGDCHVINAVWSSQLGKWLWVDPTFNAWVTDENGTMLSIQEVRERLRDDRPLRLNEEANWNNREKQTADHYLYYYMAKNLYYLAVSTNMEFGMEDNNSEPHRPHFVALMPTGFTSPDFTQPSVNDDAWFWQAPR